MAVAIHYGCGYTYYGFSMLAVPTRMAGASNASTVLLKVCGAAVSIAAVSIAAVRVAAVSVAKVKVPCRRVEVAIDVHESGAQARRSHLHWLLLLSRRRLHPERRRVRSWARLRIRVNVRTRVPVRRCCRNRCHVRFAPQESGKRRVKPPHVQADVGRNWRHRPAPVKEPAAAPLAPPLRQTLDGASAAGKWMGCSAWI